VELRLVILGAVLTRTQPIPTLLSKKAGSRIVGG
jgi:hypothetical protein